VVSTNPDKGAVFFNERGIPAFKPSIPHQVIMEAIRTPAALANPDQALVGFYNKTTLQ